MAKYKNHNPQNLEISNNFLKKFSNGNQCLTTLK